METITGTVQRILWSSPEDDNHYKVFKVRCKGNRFETVTGDFEELIEGAEIEIHGDYTDHPRYGRGFRAKAHVFTFNRDSTYSISLYMQSIAKFLGPKRAYAIAHAFGSDLENIIENHSERLLEVEEIGPKIAQNLVEAWHEHREEKSVRIFLHGLGLSQRNIKRILSSFGVESENKIRENPYLLSLVGFGFSTCDFIARKLEFDPQNPLRFRYFIIWALKEALNNGHLYLRSEQIVKIFNNYNERTSYHFKNDEITQEDIEDPLLCLIEDGFIIQEENRYYEVESFFYENESARILSLINEKEDFCSAFKEIDIEEFIQKYEAEQKSSTGIDDFKLSEEQRDAIRHFVKEKILIITGGPGTGKCLAKNTPVLMFDGSIKVVQDIKRGEFLMGDDSTPREVLSLARGTEEMFKVSPVKGEPYIVNKSHILSLVASKNKRYKRNTKVDISVSDYLGLPPAVRENLKGYRVPVSFKEKPVPVDPYLIGFWLGNGSQGDTRFSTPFLEAVEYIDSIVQKMDLFVKKDQGDNVDYKITTGSKDKRIKNPLRDALKNLGIFNTRKIPDIYKCNSRENRLRLLAGLLDSDGYYIKKDKCYDVVFKHKQLAEDIAYLARSLGFSAYPKKCKKAWNCNRKGKHYEGVGSYYRMIISGKSLNKIPIVVPKKKASIRKQIKNPLRTGITVQSIGEGEYFGFEISGNGRFLLGDFTVTHNTTVVKAFVELLINHCISFELLTPTGIAAKRLGNVAEYEAYTIHRRLGYRGSDWSYDAHQKYNTDVVIVDEISMVDMEVFYRLVSAMYTHTKFIFVGDNDQLPSVGPGRVLNEMIISGSFKTIFLRNIFRQAEKSDIIKEAKLVRDGSTNLDLLSPKKEDDIWFIRSSSTVWIEQKIVEFSRDLKASIKAKGGNKTFQIITPRNSGPLSVETLNIALQSALNPKVDGSREVQLNTCVIRRGDRVLIRKNNYDLDVFNGDIGKVTAIVKANILIDIEDFGGPRQISVPIEQAEDMLKLGYAITVHKAQGSEYDLVILPIVKAHGKRILQRNLFYTAITRAKQKVILFGQGAAVVDAIENDKIQERNTLFAERIRRWINGEGTSLQQLYSNAENYQNAKTLKRLLLSEEKASSALATTDSSYEEDQDYEKTSKETSKPVRQLSRSENMSLEKMLNEIGQLIEESEMESNPKENLDQIKGENPRSS